MFRSLPTALAALAALIMAAVFASPALAQDPTPPPDTPTPTATSEAPEPDPAALRVKLCASTNATVGELLDANADIAADLQAYLGTLPTPGLDDRAATVVAAQLAAQCPSTPAPTVTGGPAPTTSGTEPSGTADSNLGSGTGTGSQFEVAPQRAPETGGDL